MIIPSMDKKVDLIIEQKQIFKRIFSKTQNPWKIIIFDQTNHEVISSLFKIKDFRQYNITLYFNIKQQKQQLYGVTIIYLVKPNMENIEEIIKDFQKDLYSSVVIHFSSEPPSTLLSFFSKELSKRKPSAINKIKKIQYSNVGFQLVDRQMSILPENNELINLLVALKNEPLFVYSLNEQTLVDLLKQRLENSGFSLGRDIKHKILLKDQKYQPTQLRQVKKYTKVLLYNRQNDLFPVISHGITYGSLLEDIWKFNRFGNKLIDKQSQIDLNDEIWLDKKNLLISQMELEKQYNKIKTKLFTLTKNDQQYSQLIQKNKKIDWHLTTAAEIINNAKIRRLNQFHAVQEDLHIKKSLSGENKRQIIELLENSTDKNDKIRLILSYLLSVQNYNQNQVQEFQKLMPDVKKNNFYLLMKQRRKKHEPLQGVNSKYIKKIAKGLWKNLINEQKKYQLTKYLQRTKDLSVKNLTELGLKFASLSQMPLNSEIQSTVVYCIGGICFNQYANVMEFHPNVVYTGDKIANYRQFL